MAYSGYETRTNERAFLILVLMWLRAFSISTKVTFQTGQTEELGGINIERIAALEKQFLQPPPGELWHTPAGRSEREGPGEGIHRSDEEDYYRCYLLSMRNGHEPPAPTACWVHRYNVMRPPSEDERKTGSFGDPDAPPV